MRRSVLVASLLFVCLACSPVGAEDVRSSRKSVAIESGNVLASGRWMALTPPSAPLLPFRNSVDLICRKETGICYEAIGALFTSEDVPQLKGRLLAAVGSQYRVTRWDESQIEALSEKPAADVFIKVDLATERIDREHRETRARGSETADESNVVRWTLE